jgi:SAM-dependent methyltransferase
MSKPSAQLDVIEAYDRLGPDLAVIRSARQAYCEAIDRLVVANLPPNASSLLDVGAGEGTRTEAIADAAGIADIVLLEPSAGMRSLIRSERELWTSRIEDAQRTERRFDVITCLWNVLGHVPSPQKRLRALWNMCELLSPTGLVYVDVQNRYNARAYGTVATFGRWLRDRIVPSSHNGDVTVRWKSPRGEIATYGHVFTHAEMTNLIGRAGLKIVKREFVDYATGELRSSRFAGSMFFILTK